MLVVDTPRWLALRRETEKVSAEELLRRFEVRVPPVPVEEMIRRLGIAFEFTPLGGAAGEALASEQGARIRVEATDARVRRRFTAAHELCHVLWHPLGKSFRDREFTVWTPWEAEANAFAADVLMPPWMISTALHAVRGVEELAAVFDVSQPAMGFRLKNLGITR